MTRATEYREYAKECAQWAAEADSEAWRAAFLSMAERWLAAALRNEEGDRGPQPGFPRLGRSSQPVGGCGFGSAIERLIAQG